MKTDPLSLVKGMTKVASLPTIYTKVEEALANPKTSNKYLADILSEDTALTARLLRLANSAFFNFPSKVDTVTQTIIVIGTRQLREVVLASSVVSAFKNIPSELIDMESFWRHSIACGVTARIIATLRRDANVETAFVAGLLHDIGRLILFMQKAAEMSELITSCQESNTLLFKGEMELFDFDHALLGGLLLKEWKLPDRLVETTTYHHAPYKSKEYQLETATIHIADIIANSMVEGSSGERFVPPLNDKAWGSLNLDPKNISLIVEEMERQYSVAVDFVLG